MAYTLRYYKTIPQPGERDILLQIYEKDGTRSAMEIGDVIQALHLDIQGSQDDIDTPIVKTSLTMTFVDAPDHADAGVMKCGDWQEFYTPDSTYWKVILMARNASGSFTEIWGGYITPDSFSEQLRYRGSVTVVARDNIGHMQDFPFDATGNEDGMITVYDLVNAAWAKIESPMRIDWRGTADSALWLQCDGTDAPSAYVNVSAFDGMNWYDAVEKVLYSMGMVMRYIGKNIVQVSSLRYMPNQGEESISDLTIIEPKFIAYASRELAPAVKRVEESSSYDLTDGKAAPLADGVAFSGVQGSSPFYSEDVFGEQTTFYIPVWPIANSGDLGWSNIPDSTLFLDPSRYSLSGDLVDDADRLIFLAGNTGDSRAVSYGLRMVCRDFRVDMKIGRVVERFNSTSLGYAWFVWAKQVRCYLSVEQNSATHFFTGTGWQTDAYLLNIDVVGGGISLDVPLADFSGSAIVKLTIQEISLGWKIGDVSDGAGLYVAIESLKFTGAEGSLLKMNRVNTNYNESNNVIITRDPALSPAMNEVPFPQMIKNGIFVLQDSAYLPAKLWAWSSGTPQQMAVYNHLQLLSYYAKPNNVITGDIVNANLGDIRAIYVWHGREHLLQGGSLNFLNGRIEGAILREFNRYEDIWGDVTGDAGLPDVESTSTTNAEAGSSSTSQNYDKTTEVYLSGSGGGSGSSTLAGLTDVMVTNPTDGQVLMYSVGSGKWINWDKKYTLWGASDVSDTVAEDGQVLVYDKASEMWVPKTISVGGVTAIDFSLASDANNAITLTINNETKYITAAALKASLGLGSLAYKSSLAASDIPSLPWSKITSGKPTTLAGYGIADAYSQTQADARFLKLAGGTLTGTLYTKQIIAEGQVFLRMTSGDRFFRSRSIDEAGAVIAEIGFGVGSNGEYRGIYDYTNDRWLLVNYGDGRVVYQGDKFLVKTTEVYEPKDGYTTPIRLGGGVRIDGSIYLPNSGTIKMTNADGTKDVIVLQTNHANNIMFGQKTAAEGYDTYIYGNTLHFKINNGVTELLTLTEEGDVGIGKPAPACKLDINGELDSRNFVRGGSLASDPTDSFQTAIFGSSDSSFYKMRLMRKSTATDGINTGYSPIFAMKTANTHSFLSISYNTKEKCYIGGGSGDAIIWSSILYHNNMNLIPKYDHSYTIGSASLRYKSLAVSDSVQIGDAIISWDATAGMLKFDKGLYSTGAVTAGGKGSSNKYRLDNWNEWTVDSDGNVTDAKLLESSLSAKLGVELNKRLAEIEESASIGPVKIDLEYIRSATTLTPSQASTAGLTEDVINNMLAGKYTKVIPDNDTIEVWDYTAYGSGNSISIYLTQGDGFMVKSGIEMRRDSTTANWNVIYEEI